MKKKKIRKGPLRNLVKKIMAGKTEWTAEELQLYRNNTIAIEEMLRKEAELEKSQRLVPG